MKNISLTEITLFGDTQMTFKEKLETAKLLDAIMVDVIETCPVGADKSDEILVKTISASAENSVISCPLPAGASAEKAWAAIRDAKKPRLNVMLPVSVVQMEYVGHKKPAAMLDAIADAVSAARSLAEDVEFTALDATRAEEEFLFQAVRRAAEAGASQITVSDDAGLMLPEEMGAFIKKLYQGVPELYEKRVGVRLSDNLHLSAACAFEAVRAGAVSISAEVAGKNAPSLADIAYLLAARGDFCGARCGIDMTALDHAAKRVLSFRRAPEMAPLNGAEAASPAMPKSTLEKTDDISAVARASRLLGYELSGEDMARVYEAFRALAKQKPVSSRELDAIIASVAMQVPPTYTLSSYVVNSGNIISATAHVVLDRDGESVQGLSTGDGPIDAALMAIEKIVGHHYELDDFQIQSVTAGREAMGEALVKLRDGGRLFSGRGISTDVIGASIRAYLNALNKIVYREN